MLKKLPSEKLAEILEAGIEEFALHGPGRANMRTIAARAGISVGALYKYYGDKDGFFRACLDRSLEGLDAVLSAAAAREGPVLEQARQIIRALLAFSREHPGYVRLYSMLTVAGGEQATLLAEKIEGAAARLYAGRIAQCQANGDLRRDMDPAMFAFFFDSLLMTVQFSGCCGYYRERFRLYAGGEVAEREDLVERELLKFFESAFTLERDSIVHRQA